MSGKVPAGGGIGATMMAISGTGTGCDCVLRFGFGLWGGLGASVQRCPHAISSVCPMLGWTQEGG
jgi:hypothetical protein